MGEELTRKSGQPAGQNQGSTDPRSTGPRPGPTPGNPSTPTPSGGGTAPAGGSTAGSTAGKTEEKKLPGLPSVTAAPIPETPKKTPPKKKKAPAKKANPQAFDATQISALIQSVSTIVASRPGMEVFLLQPQEADQLATPIANMVAKSEKLKDLGDHADALALITAALVIFAPRVMLYSDTKKKKQLEKNGGVRIVKQERKGEGSSRKPAERNDAGRKSNPKVYASSTLDAIPSIL